MEKEINLYKIINEVINEVNCWKGYQKKGTKKLFGKTVNNCVKKTKKKVKK
jgi:hypothetical protein